MCEVLCVVSYLALTKSKALISVELLQLSNLETVVLSPIIGRILSCLLTFYTSVQLLTFYTAVMSFEILLPVFEPGWLLDHSQLV